MSIYLNLIVPICLKPNGRHNLLKNFLYEDKDRQNEGNLKARKCHFAFARHFFEEGENLKSAKNFTTIFLKGFLYLKEMTF